MYDTMQLKHYYSVNIPRSILQRVQQAVGGRPPRYAPAQACKWWHGIRHVRIWKGDHYCIYMSMLACQYNQPKRSGGPDLWPFDLESGVRVTCDVGYLCANFDLPRPFCSRLRPDVYATDRQQTDVCLSVRDRQTNARRQTASLLTAPCAGA